MSAGRPGPTYTVETSRYAVYDAKVNRRSTEDRPIKAGEQPPKALVVADLFCGGGGLSEGFRQAGFDVTWGLDKDRWSVETWARNHPGATAVQADILDFDLAQIPQCDVLVGGPPCIEFSSSKRGGNGNILDGLLLVQAYLRAVHLLQPRWWVMENVPRITKFLPAEVPLTWIGIDEPGVLHVPQRGVFNTANYGAPQARKRFLMGNYPPPPVTHGPPGDRGLFDDGPDLSVWRTLGSVLDALPDPANGSRTGWVVDPNYDLRLPAEQLTDQFHDVVLGDKEASGLRRDKEAHPFYGYMPFPDPRDRPARTVVATQLGRETLIIDAGQGRFRRATIRECATLQTFPITYQFYGGASARYRLAGDAVPPRLGFAVASGILQAEGLEVPGAPRIATEVSDPAPPIVGLPPHARRRSFRANRRFVELVPGKEVRGCRAEFDNLGRGTAAAGQEWAAHLVVGEGQRTERERVSTPAAIEQLLPHCATREGLERVTRFIVALNETLTGDTPDASTLQARWIEAEPGEGPDELVARVSKLIDAVFPREEFAFEFVPRTETLGITPRRGLRIRIAVGLVAAAYLADVVNRRRVPGSLGLATTAATPSLLAVAS